VQDERHIAARPAEMRLDDLQGEGGGDGSVEGVAALFEHAHPDRCGDPMGGGDHPEGADDLRTGGEGVGIDPIQKPVSSRVWRGRP